MPEVAAGNQTKMRLGAGRARDGTSCGLDAKARRDGCVPAVVHHRASLGWIEEFLVWKRLGLNLTFDLGARQAEAFIILEEQLTLEKQNGA